MTVALDHLFICVSPGAPEAGRLTGFGLIEGTPNRHPGQGTANRRFFFRNAMLELLWVHDAAEAQSEGIRRTRLWERWSSRSIAASPFGICFRPAGEETEDRPFPAWEYRPPYLPDRLVIQVAANTPLSEPMWFYMGFARRPDAEPAERRQPVEHPIGFREVTAVGITSPAVPQLSVAARTVVQAGLVSVRSGEEHLLEMEFDGNRLGRSADFRPNLPLVFRW